MDGPPHDDAFTGMAWLWHVLGDSPAAREQWAELLRLALAAAETSVRADSLQVAGELAGEGGDMAGAQSLLHEALIAGRATHNAASVARSLAGLSRVAVGRGAFELARSLQEEAIDLQRRLGQTEEVARSLAVLGWLSLESRGARQAEILHEESLTLRVTLGDPLALGYSLVHLGWLAHLTGRPEMARRHLAEALAAVRGCADRWKVVAILALLGRPTAGPSPFCHAATLLIGAEYHESGDRRRAERPDLSGNVGLEECGRLTPRALAVALAGGEQIEAASLVEQVLEGSELHAALQRGDAHTTVEPMPLTPRELEVAILIGRGHTNRRIADDLVIAERPVETHARNIREMLGLSSRSQIAAWIAARGLLAATSERP
jgi:non-specific serine/threonine protein kinase